MKNEKWLIDANALTDKVDESKHNNPHPQGMIRVNHRNEHDHFLRMILDAPNVEAVEVVHGRWVNYCNDLMWQECSACGYRIQYFYSKDCKYCPNCGADMRGVKDET